LSPRYRIRSGILHLKYKGQPRWAAPGITSPDTEILTLPEAHVELRQSFMRLPSELSMDDPDVVEIVKAMTSIAKMANECREATVLA
ncbi:MAG: hypothetical protein UC368_06500, partial [Eggerthellaceae bacterium]|nr:hypothetical protein [Eggerthellaceae bacterium]